MSRKSVVWKCFDKVNEDNITCNICKKQFKYSGNTTNMLKHIKCSHPFTYLNMTTNKDDRGSDDRQNTDVAILDFER